jgi:hypothetical protein
MPHLRIALLLWCLPFAVLAKDPPRSDLPALLRDNTYALCVEDDALAGPGADWLAREAADAQFVLLGEEHNLAQIPPFTTALFALLQARHGFEYFATEQPGLTLERLSAEPARGDRDAAIALARAYPFGFSFIGDEELAMLADIARRSHARTVPLWGLEQATGVALWADELATIAPTPAARDAATALAARARGTERAPRDYANGMFIAEDERLPAELVALREAFTPYPGSRADALLVALEKSREIYGYYFRAQAGEVVGVYNNTVREQWFRDGFGARYRAAAASETRPPRVLLKFGGWHMMRGRNPGSTYTLGNHLSELAAFHGQRSLHLHTVPYATLVQLREAPAEYRPFIAIADAREWRVVDLRPLRPHVHGRRLRHAVAPEAAGDFAELVFAHDALLLMPGISPATFTATGAKP